MCEVVLSVGLKEEHRTKAAELYYIAFRQKLHPIFRDEARGLEVLKHSLGQNHAITAMCGDELVGLAGFKDATGQLVDIQPKLMTEVFGFVGGWWRLLVLSLFERDMQDGVLLMDGIVVDAAMRGKGIGSQLLDATIEHARSSGYNQVRLDVVDTNPRARQLYERKGFIAGKTESYPFLQHFFGFSGSTTMLKTV